MLREVGFCSGIENYSIHFDGRKTGEAPFCLFDFFPKDFLLISGLGCFPLDDGR